MPGYLSPGVHVEEVRRGVRPVEGVPTTTAGFVGRTERGPVQPKVLTGWNDSYRWYGGHIDSAISYLPHAVQGFFENGGRRLWIARVTGSGALAGATERETFSVKCDRETMSQDDMDNGEWICHVGVAPLRPAEFIIFRIQQKTANAAGSG